MSEEKKAVNPEEKKAVSPEAIGMVKTKGGWRFPADINAVDYQRHRMVADLAATAADLHERMVAFKEEAEEFLTYHVGIANDTEMPSCVDLNGKYETLDGGIVMEVEYSPVYRATEEMTHLKELLRGALVEMSDRVDAFSIKVIKRVIGLDRSMIDVKLLEAIEKMAGDYTVPSLVSAVRLIPRCTVIDHYHPYYRFFKVDEQGLRKPIMRNFSSIKTGASDEIADV